MHPLHLRRLLFATSEAWVSSGSASSSASRRSSGIDGRSPPRVIYTDVVLPPPLSPPQGTRASVALHVIFPHPRTIPVNPPGCDRLRLESTSEAGRPWE
jgi:hypothetical protein